MTYYAFLKGINLGKWQIKMAELKSLGEELGFKNVRTFIASGNIVFDSHAKTNAVKKKLEKGLKDKFSFDVITVLRTRDEMEKIIKEYPFSKVKGHQDCKISVGFLEETPQKAAVKELEENSTDNEILVVKGNNMYHLTRGNFSDSMVFKKNLPEKILKVVCTVRNWNTTNKIMTI